MLNKQIIETKYIKYLDKNNNGCYKILHYSELVNNEAKQSCIKKIIPILSSHLVISQKKIYLNIFKNLKLNLI